MTEQKPPNDAAPRPVKPDEMKIAFEGPAIFTNRFYLTGFGDTVRISFAEQATKDFPVNFRSAVIMSVSDLRQLRNVIDHVLGGPQPPPSDLEK